MRQNLPVTQREYSYPADATLMSTTDTRSHITYANSAFVQVSGFSRDEIAGQPHNMVRHPDMPTAAFADMWATLKAGDAWTALVKNRRKDGDHYWVRANATPILRDGAVTGYMSVRTQPSRAEIDAAEALYARFREGRAGGLAFRKGLVVRTGLMAWRSVGQVMPLAWRLRLALALIVAAAIGAAFGVGLAGSALAMETGAVLLAAVLAGVVLEWQIVRPLGLVLRQAKAVAAGQPGRNINLDRIDEIGMILRAVNQSGLNLRSLVDDVSGQTNGLQGVTGAIASGNADLSARTEQAAGNLQRTAASVEQMAATVRQNADNARAANDLAGSASRAAARGGEVVGAVVQTMDGISTSSRRIADIIGVIDGIAFQTNILALNAAVEAARAGEQGRGFAVVAGEVRTLAQRSAQAAKEIKSLIAESVEKVDSGARQVGEAGQAMQDIVGKVRRVSDLISEITGASVEQSTGISQVNDAVARLDEMTRQNANLVQQSAEAATSLEQQAGRLAEAVAVYR